MASKDVMIDIETLSTDPAEALVLSIGVLEFDCSDAAGPRFLKEALWTPSIVEQLLHGRKVDRSTQDWWRAQPAETQAHWANPEILCDVKTALLGLGNFLRDVAPTRLWANGIVFDLGILENLYRSYGLETPWRYNIARDARTFYDIVPSTRQLGAGDANACIAHHPIGDCKSQVIRLWEHGYDPK